ncbi:Secreted RxLR effector protein 161 [Linum perenne]
MKTNLKLSKDDTELIDNASHYRTLVGSLIYLTSTCPYITYLVYIISQFMSIPCKSHFDAVHRILRYLFGTRDVGLYFLVAGYSTLTAFVDADLDGCVDTRRSTTSWCIKFGNSFISWRCKKQNRELPNHLLK